MRRLFVALVVVSAAAACSRAGQPLVGESLEGVGKEFVDPHYFRDMPLGFKVLWFIGPGH